MSILSNKDAAKILGLSGDINPSETKKFYRIACFKYHPDRNGCLEMMTMVNAAYKVLLDFEGNVDNQELNYGEKLNEALSQVVNLEGVIIEICGSWVWLTGNTKSHKNIIGRLGAGFKWANKKKAWYYRPEEWVSKSRGKMSLDEIRVLHGSKIVPNVMSQRISN